MSFILVRVDDRLIHGQVVVGWASAIKPHSIILYNDEIAANPWEKDLYESSFPDSNCRIAVYAIDQLLEYYYSELFLKERCILLMETPKDALILLKNGICFDVLNIGGMHYQESKKELNNYIYVNAEDIQHLNKIQEYAVKIEGQDVPRAKKINVRELIKKKKV